MCLRDGARRCSRGWAWCPAWPGRPGWRRSSGGADGASSCAHGTARGAPDAGPSADAAAAPDASDAAASDAGTASDAADAGSTADAPDAAAQHGWHAGAAAELSATQHGRHAKHVATVAAKCRCSARPLHAAATRHGIAATGSGIDGSRRNGRPRCWRHESAGRAPREYRRHDPAEPAARWWHG